MASREFSWNSPRLRILLADDEQGIRSVVGRCLEGDGHYVETADDGDQALEKFKARTWDLVITDRVMPKLGGDCLAQAIKRIHPTTPVILVTGFAGNAPDVRGDGSPFDMVISKPFRHETIRAAIASFRLRDRP
jgi:CheY-like chemotaxis protein